ncbi:hypothetical protein H257_05847 [Aphanomyces astaci]|uniref:6-phosphogluconolactonase n=1 Tax=Aphanomyces astaci TaxID=112090 RepID=W4GNJ5_APHAT|nr:hypothetical protein H257_05847 [Aphanomyces astaci]ETV81285.1 hypothetical protein H257_05847 [Aphanomyces astaci]RQM26333.1 hypothetical protein B5M09_005890 [Aphanomyces astaci]|eukprot:XP_009829143.1 hypothetical protein H257_05847 [Aphanomyces astaci]
MPTEGTSTRLLVGTYTRKEDHVDGQGKGIYTVSIDHASGKLTLIHVNDNTGINPSFVVVKANAVYAVNEHSDTLKDTFPNGSGLVASFSLDNLGRLTRTSEHPSRGGFPCHVSIDPTNSFVAVANYGGGNVTVFPIDAHDGKLHDHSGFAQMTGASLANPQRQDGPHCHSTTWLSRSTLAVLDLGTDTISHHLVHANGALAIHPDAPVVALPPGSGPRHLTLHPTLPLAYVVHELSNNLSVHSIDAAVLSPNPVQVVSLLPHPSTSQDHATVDGSIAAEVRVSKCGHFIVASIRGIDQLAVFRITYPSGLLAAPQFVSTQGSVPRHFTLVGDDLVVVANQNSHSIVSFQLSPADGLVPTGHALHIPSPSCVAVVL